MLVKVILILFPLLMVVNGEDPCKPNITLVGECCKTLIRKPTLENNDLLKALNKCVDVYSGDELQLQCIYKEQGLVSAGGINKTAFVAAIMEHKDEKLWRKVVEDSVDKCVGIMPGKKEPYDYMTKCGMFTLYINCPKPNFSDKDVCQSIKKDCSTCLKSLED